MIPKLGGQSCERVGEVVGFGDTTKALAKAEIVAQLGSEQRLADVVRMEWMQWSGNYRR